LYTTYTTNTTSRDAAAGDAATDRFCPSCSSSGDAAADRFCPSCSSSGDAAADRFCPSCSSGSSTSRRRSCGSYGGLYTSAASALHAATAVSDNATWTTSYGGAATSRFYAATAASNTLVATAVSDNAMCTTRFYDGGAASSIYDDISISTICSCVAGRA
jgi:predicted amidophosphoribosyltransferase